jgi:hypothetical protein
MSKNGLIYPKLRVLLDDGTEVEVQPLGPDQIAFEFEAVKRRWPDFQRIPATWQTYLAWHALVVREKLLPACSWDEWRNGRCTYTAPVADDDDDQADDEAGTDAPFTDPEPGTG